VHYPLWFDVKLLQMSSLRDAAMNSKAWPFEEARRVLKRYEKKDPEEGLCAVRDGLWPVGLPHIGTFGEVRARR
jgi:lysyl-tRNA synthetase class 1